MNKFTPGPWIAEQRDTRSVVLAAKGRCLLADCPQWSNRDDRPRAAEAFANAKLFAAAPDLLDALSEIINDGGKFVITHETHRKARAAIAKARGEA